MKTITLDEIAYERLKAFERAKGDSVSSVKRNGSMSGTLGAFFNPLEISAPGNDARYVIFDRSFVDRPKAQYDSWI